MGTSIDLDIRDPFPYHELTALADEVFGWFRRVDVLFSTRRAESQISLLDQGILRPIQADLLVREVLHTCALLHRRTHGYFDIHVTGRLDPSQFVTGWALQRASATLTEAGATNHRLRAGGSLYTAGRRRPLAASTLTNLNRIYDPVARCSASGLTSVTITGPNLGITNAYATAAFAMGPAALDWLPQLHDHHYTVIDGQGRRCKNTSAPVRI
ncbi:MAG: FAD:protein FMN transferase [Actinomadura sp.]